MALGSALTSCAAPSPNDALARPNFIYILVDDLGYGDLNLSLGGVDVFRNPCVKTPKLACLAAQSRVFTDHYSASPVCSPSRAGLLTGRTPERADVRLWINDRKDNDTHFLSGKEITIAEVLRDAGYATAVIGKWHLNGADWEVKDNWIGWTGSFPKQQGFEYAIVSKENPHETRKLEQNTQDNPGDFFSGNGEPLGTVEGWTSQIITDWAIKWLRSERDKSKPFFLYLPYDAVHEKIENPREYTAIYSTGDPNNDLYYGNITYLDAQIGRLIDALNELGLDGNTVVFFSSDNGPDVWRVYHGTWRSYGTSWPYHGQKRQLFEGGIRVPGMVRWMGTISPGISIVPNSTLDVLPTIAELASVDVPADRSIDGTSLAGHLLRGERPKRTKPLYWQFEQRGVNWVTTGQEYTRRYDGRQRIEKPTPQVVIRDGDFVMRAYAGGAPYSVPDHFELYDIVHDRMEERQLSEVKPATFNKMKQELLDLHIEVNRERLRRKSEIERRVDQRSM